MTMVSLSSIKDVPKTWWSKLAEQKIFFGHQSVGYNILDGIRDWMQECDFLQLRIVETSDPQAMTEPIFAHARMGQNFDPASKIRAFCDCLSVGIGDGVDIAFLKFCYVDVKSDSDPKEVFRKYCDALNKLERCYPQVRFIHVTVPICAAPQGVKKRMKNRLKTLLGKPTVWDDNQKRQQYNQLLRDLKDANKTLFDLARIEAMDKQGNPVETKRNGKVIPEMLSYYTDDGGHLNETGRKRVAEQLLIRLAQMMGES